MKILAIDTATEACSVALLNDGQKDGLFEVCPQQQSQQILPMIDRLLKTHNVSIHDLDAIAYGRGPGSFTGVRIATSTIQGLALGANLPVVEVSTLAAMAQQNYEQHQQQHCIALIDARMDEVYMGEYNIVDELAQLKDVERVCSPEIVSSYVDTKISSSLVGTGFDAYKDLLSKQFGQQNIKVFYPNALYMLGLAKLAVENCETVKVEDIKPVYLRDKVTWKKLPHKM